jgi:hypothetical protein
MAPRKAPPPAPAPFDLKALRAVREKLGAASDDDGETFTFTPDPDTVASWLQGGVAFGIPLGGPLSILDDLVDDHSVIFGSDSPPCDPLLLGDPEEHDVNKHVSHYLSIESSDDVIVSVSYEMRGWSFSDDAITLHQGKHGGFVGKNDVPLPRHDNTRFREILAKALPAMGFPLRGSPARTGKKERDLPNGSVQVRWTRYRAESLFDIVGLNVYARHG